MAEIEWPTVAELAEQVRRKERAAVEVVDQALAAIEAGNEALNARSWSTPIRLADGRRGRRRRRGTTRPARRRAFGEGPRGLRRPAHVARLAAVQGWPPVGGGPGGRPACGRGAVPLGKTAAPSSARSTSPRRRRGVTRNPWDPTRTPGGRAAVRRPVGAGLVPIATASDGGGSTCIPAGFTGLVGLKAGYGRIPNLGASGSQTAVNGVLTTTADAARHLDVVAGPDSGSAPRRPRRGSPTSAPSRSWTRPASGPAGRSTSGSPPSTRRLLDGRGGRGAGDGRRPRAGRRPGS